MFDRPITTCCPQCGATFKTEQKGEICLNCSHGFKTKPNEILTNDEVDL